MKLQDRVAELVATHGSYRAAAKVTGINHPYLHRLGSGEKVSPSAETLSKLGLRAETIYHLAEKPNVRK